MAKVRALLVARTSIGTFEHELHNVPVNGDGFTVMSPPLGDIGSLQELSLELWVGDRLVSARRIDLALPIGPGDMVSIDTTISFV